MNETYVVEQLTLLSPEDILTTPAAYANPEYDVPLARVTTKGLEDNPTLIMLGVEEKGQKRFYLVVEDNDMSEDHFSENNGEDLVTMYKELVQWILAMDQEWLHGGTK